MESKQKETSEAYLNFEEVSEYVQHYLKEGLELIEQENYLEAIDQLKEGEDLLEALTTQGGPMNPDFILATLHNTALAYQRSGNLDECSLYLDGCAYNAKHKKVMTSEDSETKVLGKTIGERLRRERYMARTQIQLCAVLSQLNKHEAALGHAKLAARLSHSLVNYAHNACEDHIERLKKGRTKKASAHPQFSQLSESVNKALPVLEYLVVRSSGSRPKRTQSGKLPKLDMRSVLGVQHYHDRIYDFNIGDLINMEPLTLMQMKSPWGLLAELTKDSMFEKICLLVVSYFCVGIEVKFICQEQESPLKLKEGKNWVKRAYNIAKALLPPETPLLSHISQSLQRNFKSTTPKRTSVRKPVLDTSKVSKSPIRETPLRKFPSRLRASSSRPKKKAIKKTKESVSSKKLKSSQKLNPKLQLKESKPEEQPKASKTTYEFSNVLTPKEPVYSSSSEDSFDPDYVREHFVISSNALYGIESSESEEEVKKSQLIEAESNETRAGSSTGGKN